jgi:hypothetical protein
VKGILRPVERVRYVSRALSRLAFRTEVNVAIKAIHTIDVSPFCCSYLPPNLNRHKISESRASEQLGSVTFSLAVYGKFLPGCQPRECSGRALRFGNCQYDHHQGLMR